MKIAAHKGVVKRRMDDFLWREKSDSSVRLRGVLKQHFFQFNRVAIVGGMVRDFARAGRRGFHSDVDLVVEGDEEAVAEFACRHSARENKFGGYSIELEGWKLDFWALGTTWASREGHARVEKIEDIAKCTFFDWDAILYDVKDRTVICSDLYLDHMRSGRIDIVLEENPSVTGSLYRAVRRLLLWNIQPGPRLASYIDCHLDKQRFDDLVQEERHRDDDGVLLAYAGAPHLRACLQLRYGEGRRSRS